MIFIGLPSNCYNFMLLKVILASDLVLFISTYKLLLVISKLQIVFEANDIEIVGKT